jgi:hypothetical protein
MTKNIKLGFATVAAAVTLAISAEGANNNGDLIIGFSSTIGNDLMVDIGQASSLTNGESWDLSTPLGGFDLTTVNWGVIGCNRIGTPAYSWTTVPNPPAILALGGWGQVSTAIKSIYSDFSPSGGNPVPGTELNWPVTDQNSWYAQTINTTLSSQYGRVVGNPNAIGETNVTFSVVVDNGSAPTVLGSFALNGNGLVTFNTVSVAPSAPPAPQIVRITRVGGTSTVFFTTTNGTYTYTLYYTNTLSKAGSVTNWPASPTTVTGNGNTNSLTDTTTDALRFYRVGVH